MAVDKKERSALKYNFWGVALGIARLLIVTVLVALEVFIIYKTTTWLKEYSALLYAAIEILGICVVVALFSQDDYSTSFKMRWMLIILIIPVIGVILYYLWGRTNTPTREKIYMTETNKRILGNVSTDEKTWNDFSKQYPDQVWTARSMIDFGFTLYSGTQAEYHGVGEDHFEVLYEELERAEKFIFMEYFIIGEGDVWKKIFSILTKKAREGVVVLLLYDDIGSIITLKQGFKKRMEAAGIHARIFNPVGSYFQNFYMNYRNHQKITVIDGNVAFTGGVNLSDEYANLYVKHGHWKDTGMMIKGAAVQSMTAMFLIMWDITTREKSDLKEFLPNKKFDGKGFFLPISDGPSNNPKNPAEDLYKQMIINSKKYCYITTPYLIIDDDLADILRLSALSGVDIRLIVPHIGDHWYVHMVTRSYYGRLISSGIKIYEYTPGFIHAKMIVSDDQSAVLGTVNMDFRSFYLHYENAVWMCGTPAVLDIKKDILETIEKSELVTLESYQNRPVYIKITQSLLNLLAPLM